MITNLKKFLYSGIIIALASGMLNCQTDDSEDNSALLLAAVAAAAGPNCTINEVQFFTIGEVACANNIAVTTGTAFLNAATQHTDHASVGVNITANTDSVRFFSHRGSQKTNEENAGEAGIIIPASGNAQMYGTELSAGDSTPTMNGGTGTYCLEVHSDGGEGHIIAEKAACATKSSATLPQRTGTGLGGGNTWGFVLKEASISDVSTNAEEQFTD